MNPGFTILSANRTPDHGGVDPYTRLLVNFNGANAGTSGIESVTGSALTFIGNAQTSTAQSVFGGSSGLFDGSGDGVTAPASSTYGLGAGDFALDCWVRFNSLPGSNLFASIMNNGWDAASQFGHFWGIFNNAGTRRLEFHWSTNGSTSSHVAVNWTPSINTWYHLAITRSGTTGRFFANGVQQGSNVTISGTVWTSTAAYRFGSSANNYHYLDGYLQSCRQSVGTPRWTSNFTPPAMPYS